MRDMPARRLLRGRGGGGDALCGRLVWQRDWAELAGRLLRLPARPSLLDGLDGARTVSCWLILQRERRG